ncbi:MAG: exonuclease SbcCD subunit D [Oscillospiraceae bacterium]|nr:exonuclease SbcCD subunit D [Oscillospiraceae bacterium]
MKLIHTSDWHFGMPLGTDSYEESQRYFLEQLYELIRRENVEAVLCAGDIYDSSVTNADAVNLFNETAEKLCMDLKVKFILIAGNHDSAARLASCRELLKASGMYVTGRLSRDISPVLLDEGKTAVYCLPYFTRDEAAALFPEKKGDIRSQEDAAMVICDHIRAAMDPSRRNIVMSHAFIVDAELSDSDRSAKIGYAAAVSKDVFEGFDYVALGHIHKPQQIAPHIRYSGSPLKYSFGAEESHEKGVVLIDTEAMEQRFVVLPMLRDRLTVTGTYDELIANENLRDCYLRLHVTDRYAGLELQAELRERFPYLIELIGKSAAAGEELSTLSVEELEKLDDSDIMIRFFEENYQTTPTAEQIELFRTALEETLQEVDLG